MQQDYIRNFCIIAHIDHGKSTLADRLIELTHTVEDRKMKEQLLDQMDLERERGITIKLQPVQMRYRYALPQPDGSRAPETEFLLNLIDTPGHVDFNYEVLKSLQACEGALLLVDASQGVEAQTVANCYTALDLHVEVVPVLNKMDLPQADPDNAKAEIEDVIGIDATDAIPCSAKTGMGIDEILEAVITRMPAPRGNPDGPPRAMIIDSWFDNYVGVVMLVRVVEKLNPRIKVSLATPPQEVLFAGEREDLEELADVDEPPPALATELLGAEYSFVVVDRRKRVLAGFLPSATDVMDACRHQRTHGGHGVIRTRDGAWISRMQGGEQRVREVAEVPVEDADGAGDELEEEEAS